MLSEKLLIWNEIKKAAPAIMKAGGNAVELLLWSQGKTQADIRKLLGLAKIEGFENIKQNMDNWNELVKSEEKEALRQKVKSSKKGRRAVKLDLSFEDIDIEDIEDIDIEDTNERIRELVEYEENNMSKNEGVMLGLVSDSDD